MTALAVMTANLSDALGPPPATVLGMTADKEYFTINGEPTFLNGISYYGALAIGTETQPGLDTLTADLDSMLTWGCNWLRVWTHWGGAWDSSYVPPVWIPNLSVTDTLGNIRQP